MRLSFKNKATPDNIRVTIVAKSNSSIKLIGDVTAPGNNPTMVLNNGELVFCLAPVITQGVWVLNPEFNITSGIVTYSAYKNIRSTKYFSHANLALLEPVMRSFQNEGMQLWKAVKDACNELTGGSTYTWDVANECIAYTEHPRVTCTTTESCQQFEYLYRSNTNKYYSTPDCVAEIGAAGWWGNTIAVPLNAEETEYACRGDSAAGDRAYLSKVINSNYDPSMVELKTIKLNVVAQKIISNTQHSNQATSLLAEVYLEEVAKSIFETIQFITKDELLPQFEENIIRVSYQGVDQEHVKVTKYTSSALDFEKGLVDKIPNTIWNMSGNYLLQNTNVLSSGFSLETKALGDSLYTNSNIITGGSTPFTIEFYALIKGGSDSSGYKSLLSKIYNGRYAGQGFYITNNNRIQFQRQESSGTPLLTQDGRYNKHNNEIIKYTFTYDGSALRMFHNDKLDLVAGTSVGFYMGSDQPITFMSLLLPSAPVYNSTTFGLIDNINIFDGEARVVRDYDEHADKLVVDLAFDGENNSTKIVDNGTAKSNWVVNGNAKISTDQKFDGFSSLFIPTNSYISSTVGYTASNEVTISMNFMPVSNNNYMWGCLFTVKDGLCVLFNDINTGSQLRDSNNNVITTNSVKIGEWNSITVTLKGSVLSFNLNGIVSSNNISNPQDWLNASSILIGKNNTHNIPYNGYIKNFKIYKDVAIIPESPVGKIQLDFDNNLTDKYNNSTWTNNGVTFDQVNSVKGYSVNLDAINRYIYVGGNSNLNYGTLDFKISMDILTTVHVQDPILISCKSDSHNTNGSSYIQISKTSLTLNNHTTNTEGTNAYTTFIENIYYNIEILKRSKSILMYSNNVLIGATNSDGRAYNLNYNNGTYIGTGGWNPSSDWNSNYYRGYIDNFKSTKDYQEPIVIDKPAVHLPLETNAINTGFTSLTVNSVGSPTYTTIDGKKCIKFESGKYLSINSNNIFNLGNSSDFYIECDIYPLSSTLSQWFLSDGIWVYSSVYLGITTDDKLTLTIYKSQSFTIKSSNLINRNSWNKICLYRNKKTLCMVVNGVVTNFNDVSEIINFTNANTYIGQYSTNGSDSLNGYMSNFKMFVGTSEIPETYNDKKVLDLDFKPTRKSYLFKDNNNKCVIHPVNITQRDYQDSKYCCDFNGTNQYLQLGKNDLLNFGNDDFVINIKFNSTSTTGWRMIMCDNASSTNFIDIDADYKLLAIKVGGSRYDTPLNSIMPNTVYNVIIQVINSILTVKINDIQSTLDGLPSQIVSNVNFNLSSNTFIGQYFDGTERFKGTIYSIKVLRNTSDVTLLEDVWVDPFPPEPEVPPFEEGVLNFTELLEDIDPHNVVLDFKQLRYT